MVGQPGHPGARRNGFDEMHHSHVAPRSQNDPISRPQMRRIIPIVLIVDDTEPERIYAGIIGTVDQVRRREYPVAVHQRSAPNVLAILEETHLSGARSGRITLHRFAPRPWQTCQKCRRHHQHDDNPPATRTHKSRQHASAAGRG